MSETLVRVRERKGVRSFFSRKCRRVWAAAVPRARNDTKDLAVKRAERYLSFPKNKSDENCFSPLTRGQFPRIKVIPSLWPRPKIFYHMVFCPASGHLVYGRNEIPRAILELFSRARTLHSHSKYNYGRRKTKVKKWRFRRKTKV